MGKITCIKKLYIDSAVKDMDICMRAVLNNGTVDDFVTSPELLVKSIVDADKKAGIFKKKANDWRFIAIIGAISAGYLIKKNYDLKKELSVCKNELEMEKEMNYFASEEEE